jgi:hypothetical protein
MTLIGRYFGLSDTQGGSVSCVTDGVFLGEVPLLERSCSRNDFQQWEPRPVCDLNHDLSKRYGVPIDINAKIGGLVAIARALNRNDLLHAQIATLHLQIPDPPALTKAALNASEIVDLARQLRASGLLKADWDPLKHPRWPAGAPGSIGGEFAPQGSVADDSGIADRNSPASPHSSLFQSHSTGISRAERRFLGRPRSRLDRLRRRMSIPSLSHEILIRAGRNV